MPSVAVFSAFAVPKESVSLASVTIVRVFIVTSQMTPFTVEVFGEQDIESPAHKAIAAKFKLFIVLFLFNASKV